MQTDVGLKKIASDLRVALGAARATTAGLSDDAVLELMADFEAIGRLASAGQVHTAGEVGVRSRAELGDEGLSRSQNFTSPVKLVAHVTGASARECKSRLDFGQKLRGAVLLGGGEGPAPFPVVARVLDEGVLGVFVGTVGPCARSGRVRCRSGWSACP
jgi:L-asparaginase/Glu-tRNA(Gln) amidotransferase subunit D